MKQGRNKKGSTLKKTSGRCAHCGKELKESTMTLDHFIPQIYDGEWDKRNLFPLCEKCNAEKGSTIVDPFDYYKFAYNRYLLNALKYYVDWNDTRGPINNVNNVLDPIMEEHKSELIIIR